MNKPLIYFSLSILLVNSPFAVAAQYPAISQEVESEAKIFMAEVEKKSDEAWENALPIIKAEASMGKPFIPWAAYPAKHLLKKK